MMLFYCIKAHNSFPLPLECKLLIDLVHTSLAPDFAPGYNTGSQPVDAVSQHRNYHLRLSAEKDDAALPALSLVLSSCLS